MSRETSNSEQLDPSVEIFTFCQSIQDHGGGSLSIIHTFDTITAKEFPVRAPVFYVAVRVRFFNSKHHNSILRLELTADRNEKLISCHEKQLVSDPNSEAMLLSMPIQLSEFLLDSPGQYSAQLYLDGQFLADTPFKVCHQGQPELNQRPASFLN